MPPIKLPVVVTCIFIIAFTLRCCRAQCIVTVAGPLHLDGAPARALQLSTPFGVADDGTGGFYFAETASHIIRRVYSNATIFCLLGLPDAPPSPGMAARERLAVSAALLMSQVMGRAASS